jgi:hypothetical protein
MAGTLSVQSILERFLPGQPLDRHRRKVCARLTGCRTARMGGMEMRCDHCQAPPSVITVAGIGIVRNVRAGRVSSGVHANGRCCCRCLTSIWCLRCPTP